MELVELVPAQIKSLQPHDLSQSFEEQLRIDQRRVGCKLVRTQVKVFQILKFTNVFWDGD